MNEVQPIREKRHINALKKALRGRDLLLFVLGINSGLRISDIRMLKVGDVRDKDFVTIEEKKTGKKKRFFFNSAIKKAVAELVPANASDDDWLFPSRKGNQPITRVRAYGILNEAVERAGLKEKIGTLGCHSLRKTFGYHAYKNGTDLSLLQSIFNHSRQSVTLRYIGINQDRIDEVYANVNL
ncbi:tyrosine-type recombinase/integrase [Bacillus paralicheniformis]|uniref:tyrosine-type recombinase/integrase n=1 Tax=Bacillus paralicheniformis TaxID=1648923 RepID=UPI002243AB1E|nr:tyrosine-type recombinase/integrase [Bacillus paralicheniformis]MEC1023562.1 tyrosine-type recombinase/integrase [Bacillus paralicheniformis]MEC1027430.1 tyrosine-type recombinase/integrase [Bacillus paralicheniformis]MEC1034394.1 tyrosine-type recombinase/integrase [Bacillus paralicheniformis]MEC1050223.1 tyrosine-type recombinase/integrase [Bacillus paralicheniformis]MEC1059839.1 tyrosine-type recombinase/integrase [Bacillus paralicheniformis]